MSCVCATTTSAPGATSQAAPRKPRRAPRNTTAPPTEAAVCNCQTGVTRLIVIDPADWQLTESMRSSNQPTTTEPLGTLMEHLPSPMPNISCEQLQDMAERGVTRQQAATEVGVSYRAITLTCERYGIQLLPLHDEQGRAEARRLEATGADSAAIVGIVTTAPHDAEQAALLPSPENMRTHLDDAARNRRAAAALNSRPMRTIDRDQAIREEWARLRTDLLVGVEVVQYLTVAQLRLRTYERTDHIVVGEELDVGRLYRVEGRTLCAIESYSPDELSYATNWREYPTCLICVRTAYGVAGRAPSALLLNTR
jgi:hypothetical protein